MYTLNYKALLIKTSFIVFIRSIAIYLLVTTPAAAADLLMYMMSAVYAVSFGWIAAVLFLFFLCVVYKIKAGLATKNIFLYTSVVAAVVIAFQMMEVMGVEYHIWQSGAFLLFPAAAIISGWISLAISTRTIKKLFVPEEINFYDTVFANTAENTEQHSLNKAS